jgi:CzcA family heavy metal efflux pump
MKFSEFMQAHRRSILFLLVTLAISGAAASFSLPVTLFPKIGFPRVAVFVDSGDRPAEQMVLQITDPVEEAVRLVPGVRNVRSTTSRGSAEVSINFDWGTDMQAAALQVNAAVTRIMPSLPPDTAVFTQKMDTTAFPIIAYSLTSPTVPLTELRDLAQYKIRPLLSSVEGVSSVQILGGEQEEYRVTADPTLLQAYGLTLEDVSRTLGAANVVQAVGRLEDHYKLYLVVSDTRLKDIDDIRHTVLKTGSEGVVRLEDIATVEMSTVPQWIKVNSDGRDSVIFQIFQQPGSNSVRIAGEVKARLDAFSPHMPRDVHISNWYDQSELVTESAKDVRDAIFIGVVLAALVLLLFLRNFKLTVIAVIVVPAVLAATVVLLYALGMSFNIMTLGGMAAAVGLIIDDAIVMLEQITRRLRGSGAGQNEAVLAAAEEFTQPLLGSSASTVVIFLPLAFLSGVTGAFFKALSLTMGAALVISFFISLLALPVLAERLLGEKDATQEEGGRITDRVHGWYGSLMGALLDRPYLVLAGILPLLILGWFTYSRVGTGFMPAMDEGGFILDYRSAPGTSLTETDRLLRQVEDIVKATPEVETYSRRTGTQLGGGLTEANEGDFFIRLKPPPRRPIEDVMDDIRGRVEKDVPGLDIEMAQLMEDFIGDLTAVPQPIEVKIFSDDEAVLKELTDKTVDGIKDIQGVVDIKSGIIPAGDALDVHVDRVKAAMEGVDPEAVTGIVGGFLGGTVTTQVQKGVKMVGVRAWIPQGKRNTVNDVGELRLRAPDGHMFPLKRVATIEEVSGQPQITRENFRRMATVTARITGRDMGSVISDIKGVLNKPGFFPKDVLYELGGMYQQQQIAFRGLITVFSAAVALVFLLLLFLYERFRIVISIIVLPVFSVAAVFIGLWLTGIELNISSMMGMTMIVGIVTEVAVFYFSEYQEFAKEMARRDALIMAGKTRMRPIAMTTIAAILALMPLALALGHGSTMQQPLAVAIISGLVVQLPLVLVVMPVVYSVMQPKRTH